MGKIRVNEGNRGEYFYFGFQGVRMGLFLKLVVSKSGGLVVNNDIQGKFGKWIRNEVCKYLKCFNIN